jgi:hypothetical protein
LVPGIESGFFRDQGGYPPLTGLAGIGERGLIGYMNQKHQHNHITKETKRFVLDTENTKFGISELFKKKWSVQGCMN